MTTHSLASRYYSEHDLERPAVEDMTEMGFHAG